MSEFIEIPWEDMILRKSLIQKVWLTIKEDEDFKLYHIRILTDYNNCLLEHCQRDYCDAGIVDKIFDDKESAIEAYQIIKRQLRDDTYEEMWDKAKQRAKNLATMIQHKYENRGFQGSVYNDNNPEDNMYLLGYSNMNQEWIDCMNRIEQKKGVES